MPIKNLIDQKFGRLRVINFDRVYNERNYWNCVCDCGNTLCVRTDGLTTGHTQSCGCLNKEIITKHGASSPDRRHPLYTIWCGMKQRCNDKKCKAYPDYGGRGIKIYKEWNKSYEAFRDYVIKLPGCPKHIEKEGAKINKKEDNTLDRKNNNKGYFPGNMRWASIKEQLKNRRKCHS